MADTKRIDRGRGHSYLVDGQKVPGVTTIINDGFPKPALIAWGPKMVAQYVADRLRANKVVLDGGHEDTFVVADDLIADLAELAKKNRKPFGLPYSATGVAEVLKGVHYEDRDTAANRGTEVHRLVEQLASGEEVTVPDELVGHVDAYLRFRDDFDPTDELVELVVVNRKHRYMGTLDLICTIEGLGRCLIDVKTNRSGPFGEVALQLAPYRFAETYLDPESGDEKPMPKIDWTGVLWLRGDGYDLYPFEAGPAEFRTFLYVQQVAHFQKERSRHVKGEALAPGAS